MSYIEFIKEVESTCMDGIYTVSDKFLENQIDIDRQSYIIGTIVDTLPVLLPSIGLHLRNYYSNNTIHYDIRQDIKQLKV